MGRPGAFAGDVVRRRPHGVPLTRAAAVMLPRMPAAVRASHDQGHGTTTRLRTAFVLNLTFTLVEVVGGLFTNSLAILSDSLHDLGDSRSIGFSW